MCIHSVVGWCPYGAAAVYTLRVYCVYTALICAADFEFVHISTEMGLFIHIHRKMYTADEKCTHRNPIFRKTTHPKPHIHIHIDVYKYGSEVIICNVSSAREGSHLLKNDS